MDNIFIIILGAGLLFGLILLIAITIKNKYGGKLNKEEYRKRWQHIEKLASSDKSGWQLAIMEADKLLDSALKDHGYPGQTMGDRLKDARNDFRNTDNIWHAHKLRNRLAHEHDVKLSYMIVQRALRNFKSGLKDLGAL